MAPGLVVSATYYNVKFTDAIAVPPFLSPILFSDPGYSSFYNTNPTLAEAPRGGRKPPAERCAQHPSRSISARRPMS